MTALARAVDELMAVQHEHSWKVAEYAVGIAERLGWNWATWSSLQMAAILHDVGKVSILDHVLRKPTPDGPRVGGNPPEPPARRGDGLAHPGPGRRSCRGSATRSSASTAAATRTA